jgi:probable phosphoglycerate mutase
MQSNLDSRIMMLLIRHGQSTANRDGLLVGRTDVALTEKGEQQAASLSGRLGNVRVAFSSPLVRAKRTAELAVPGVDIKDDTAFIEMHYGDLDGQLLADVGRETWRALQEDHDWRVPGGESMKDVDERVHARLDDLFSTNLALVASSDEHIAIFSHVSPVKSAVAWALGVHGGVAWRLRLDNATVTAIGAVGSRPTLLKYNERR